MKVCVWARSAPLVGFYGYRNVCRKHMRISGTNRCSHCWEWKVRLRSFSIFPIIAMVMINLLHFPIIAMLLFVILIFPIINHCNGGVYFSNFPNHCNEDDLSSPFCQSLQWWWLFFSIFPIIAIGIFFSFFQSLQWWCLFFAFSQSLQCWWLIFSIFPIIAMVIFFLIFPIIAMVMYIMSPPMKWEDILFLALLFIHLSVCMSVMLTCPLCIFWTLGGIYKSLYKWQVCRVNVLWPRSVQGHSHSSRLNIVWL